MKTRHLILLAGGFATLLAPPALPNDVTVQLGAGDGFVVEDDTGAIERLRVDEATGNFSRNGDLFVHTSGSENTFVGALAGSTSVTGSYNVAFGQSALSSITSGSYNAAFGPYALELNTTGADNSAFGDVALNSNTSGSDNSAFGDGAMFSNVGGSDNSAFGALALFSNSGGNDNSAFGMGALRGNTSGKRNVAIGKDAGSNQTTGADNIYLANTGAAGESGKIKIGTTGTHTDAFIAGIDGNVVAGSAVLVTASGELGVPASSFRFKRDVRDMGAASEALMQLRPVTFAYREEVGGAGKRRHYGLLAEEVAEVAPELVQFDERGQPFSVHYHVLGPMLLNELQKQRRTLDAQHATIESQARELEEQAAEIEALRARQQELLARQRQRMAALTARLERLEAGPQLARLEGTR